jgi:hypothetical protein
LYSLKLSRGDLLVDNNLKGLIPFEVGLLGELTVLNVGVNDISSPLPSLENLSNLTEIVINNNDFDGKIPNFSTLSRLQTLDISNNEFEGTLFDVWNLTELKSFKVAGNVLTGTVPLSLQNLVLDTLHLQRNKISGSIDFLCENLPREIDLDCYDNDPEMQCNCCIGCTFVSVECTSSESVAVINIPEASEDFVWQVYKKSNSSWNYEEVLVAAGGMYEEGETIDINLCLAYPGDYLIRTEVNSTDEEISDIIPSISVGDDSIPLIGRWGGIWTEFSLDSDGLPYNVLHRIQHRLQ